ncbi:MAG TPA: hypothetical protein PK854_10285 [Oscillospiraceae bacterium]|nr:hypothetical protein [Oscillospiraceae bacterium]HPS35641.1 hypothetical protein [Oscillospiraceae bacterium]
MNNCICRCERERFFGNTLGNNDMGVGGEFDNDDRGLGGAFDRDDRFEQGYVSPFYSGWSNPL